MTRFYPLSNSPGRWPGLFYFWALLPLFAGLGGLGLLGVAAPRYLGHQGFPLDDAWIHAVYARELARSGLLAYNPGVPATGDTSPLWPLLLAPIHRLASSVEAMVLATKLLGFTLHLIACTLVGATLARLDPGRRPLAFGAAAIVAIHPDLLAASLSGMEVPCAALVVAGALAATVRGSALALVLLGAAAIGARPETAAMVALIPALFWMPVSPRRAVRIASMSVGGSIAALLVWGLRNRAVSGMLLPATFYAKANMTSPFSAAPQIRGFIELLGGLRLVDSPAILVGGLIAAVCLLTFGSRSAWNRAAGALYLSGLAFCALSFALLSPSDPLAFYHQRYVLPGVLMMIAALPPLIDVLIRVRFERIARVSAAIAVAALALVLIAAIPARAHRLSNDAQNIDDVQVAFGRALADAPPSAVAWVVDAGASRFFGRPFIVDMIGLNSPALLTAGAQSFLDEHPPSYLDVFPDWSSIDGGTGGMPVTTFETTTSYTVTSDALMRRHLLIECRPPGAAGRFAIRQRRWTYRCAPPSVP